MTRYDPNIHHRQSTRLKGYDYTLPGAYFVTIVTQGRECLFGQIADSEMKLNPTGQLVAALWQAMPLHFPISLDIWVLMPNHLHGIIIINDHTLTRECRGEAAGLTRFGESTILSPAASPLQPGSYPPNGTIPGSLGAIIQNFKSMTTRRVNALNGTPGMLLWQRNYHDRIVRNDKALDNIRKYILANPVQWPSDDENPLG